MINVYFDNHLPFNMVDIFLAVDGTYWVNPYTQNAGPDLNMAMFYDDLGITPQQIDTLREFAKQYQLVFHIEVTQ